MSGHLCLKWNNHSSAFLKSINKIHLKDRYCDATIVCQGKYFPVHRIILSTCSDYFDEIFERIQCPHPYIVFKDIETKEMEMLLSYMYQGEVNVVQEMLPTLIKAAEALQIKGLAVPDEMPCTKDSSSGKKRSNVSSETPQSKRRLEERQRRNSTESSTKCKSNVNDTTSLNQASNNANTSHYLDTPNEGIKIKEENLANNEYENLPLQTDFGNPSSASEIEQFSKEESNFGNHSSIENVFIKTEPPLDSTVNYNDQSCSTSAWTEFEGGTNMEPLPPNELSNQDDIYENIRGVERDSNPLVEKAICEDVPTSSYESANPMKTHSNYCPYCNYESYRVNAVKRHIMYKHTGEQPFGCKVCFARFTERNKLEVHMRRHTGEKPYKCPHCSLKFTYQASLKRHFDKSACGQKVL